MGKLIRNATPAGELANKRLAEASASAEDRYPDGAIFIGSDEEHFSAVFAEAVTTSQPLVVVYPDGEELIGEPHEGRLAFSASSNSAELAKGFAHPLRVQILIILGQRPAHEIEVAKELNQSLSDIHYHFRSLDKFGLIDLVETKQLRGSTVHVYQAASLTREAWEQRLVNVGSLHEEADNER